MVMSTSTSRIYLAKTRVRAQRPRLTCLLPNRSRSAARADGGRATIGRGMWIAARVGVFHCRFVVTHATTLARGCA